MKEQEARTEDEYRLMTEAQQRKKNFEKNYYWTTDGNENRRWYVSGDPRQRFYTISRVSPEGYRRSGLELAVRFILFVAEKEGEFIKKQDPYLWLKYHAKVDKDLQGMYDYLSTAKKMNIEHAEQIGDRIADVGKQMNALRQERTRHKKSTEKHKQLIDAYRTYTRFRPLVEGVKEPQSSTIGEYTKAYTVLAQNQILTAEAYALLCRRYNFEKQKIVDYTKRMPLLKRQYHDLKRLEALAIHPTKYLQEIYSYSERAYLYAPQDNRSVDNILHEAYTRSAESIRKSVEEKSIDTK